MEYLVPRAVRTRFELFPGWGVAEIAAAGLGLGLGLGLQAGWAALGLRGHWPLVMRFGLGVLPAVAGLLAARSGNAWGSARAWRAYTTGQRRYLYVHRGFALGRRL